jgi:hypothetical protein
MNGRRISAIDEAPHAILSRIGSTSPFAHGRKSSRCPFRHRPSDHSYTVHPLTKFRLLQRLSAALDHFSKVAVGLRVRDRKGTLDLQRQPHDRSVRQRCGIDDHIVERFAEVGLLLGEPLHDPRVEGRLCHTADHGCKVLRSDFVFVGKSSTAGEFR